MLPIGLAVGVVAPPQAAFTRLGDRFLFNTQTTIGMMIVGLSVIGWLNARRVLELSNVMRRMVERCGDDQALQRVRWLCLCGTIFGASLATGLINPMTWE